MLPRTYSSIKEGRRRWEWAPRSTAGTGLGMRGGTVGDHSYLIRYGVMSHVGRFSAVPVRDTSLERGQLVVIQTDRGVELGEVLIALDGQSAPAAVGQKQASSASNCQEPGSSLSMDSPHVLRLAGPDDLSRFNCAEELRPSRFVLCQQILREGNWPWELIDVETLLDGRATVLHYLGPHQLDVAPLRARFRVECDFDVVLEPVGSDLDSELADGNAHDADVGGGCGSCGGCADGGGCASEPERVPASHHQEAEPKTSGCASQPHSACSSCGISRLMAERSAARA